MVNRVIKFALLTILISALPSFFAFSQTNSTSTEGNQLLNESPNTLNPIEERQQLEEELKKLEEQIAKYEADIEKTQKEKKTLQNQIYILKQKIEKLDLQIQQGNLMIKDLTFQIKDTEASINQTSLKIEDSQKILANILQLVYEEDQKSLIEILLAEKEISDFFDNLMALQALNSKSQELLKNIKILKSYLEGQKQSLDEEKTDLERIVKLQGLQRQESQSAKKDQEYFLRLTEAQYQKYLKEKETAQKRVAEIRARVFELIGVPEAPKFGEALEIAKYVESVTGVKPALLLAVLTQESKIGKNVGQCYLKNPSTGEGIRIKNGEKALNTMNPAEVPYFLEIIQSLNQSRNLARDPFETPVSCCMFYNGKPYGWGGAMGPGQFMPSTWLKYGYGKKVEEITGKVADPWDIKDSFLAAALYLKDLGATQNEFKAVMRYFSGSSWQKWEEFYGNSVLQIASQYEEDIKELESAG